MKMETQSIKSDISYTERKSIAIGTYIKKRNISQKSSWIERINIIKMSSLPKVIYRFNTIPIKIPMAFFTEQEKIILKFLWMHQRSKAVLNKGNKTGSITTRDFKSYKTIITKTVYFDIKISNRPIKQQKTQK